MENVDFGTFDLKFELYSPSTGGCPGTVCSTCTSLCEVISATGVDVVTARDNLKSSMDIAGDVLHAPIAENGGSRTVCVPVKVPTGASILGFKQVFSNPKDQNLTPCVSPSDYNISYTLKSVGCSGSSFTPKTSNATGSTILSGFNPEWEIVSSSPSAGQIIPGDYVLCYTLVNNSSTCKDLVLLSLGYYVVAPNPPCSANPGTFTAKINGLVVTGNSFDLNANDKLEIISRILKLVGVNLKDAQVEQYANMVTTQGQ
jgi:hypothetical protein